MAMSFDDALNALDRRLSEKATYCKTDPKPSITPGGSELRSQTGLSLRELITSLEDTLTTLESELNCPVCYGILAAAHVANPCGHTFCGACGQKWVSQKRECPVCRARVQLPLIPNFVTDNTVQQCIRALGYVGRVDWQCGGPSLEEWNLRQAMWHKSRKRRRLAVTAVVMSDDDDDDLYVPTDTDDEE